MIKTRERHRIITLLALCGLLSLGFASTAVAQGDAAGPNTGKIGLSLGNDFTTHYFFRGIVQEDQGFITQPWAEIGINIFEGDSDINSVGLVVGIWNSIHDEQTGADAGDAGPEEWYESDIYVSVVLGIGEKVEAGLSYIAYTSPNDAFETIQEIDLTFSFDDAACWEEAGFSAPGFEGLQPTITIAFEIDETAFGPDEGTYIELALSPSFVLIDDGDNPVMLLIPITAGFSISDYYDDGDDDDSFGFFDVGIFLSKALDTVPSDYGQWAVEMGVDLLFLSGNIEEVNSDNGFEAIGSFKISMDY